MCMETTLPPQVMMKNVWLPEIWTIASRIQENRDTVSLELLPNEGGRPYEARPGQFNMIYSPGRGEIPVSISSIRSGSLLHTIRRVGAISGALVDAEAGTGLGLRGPFGSSWPLQEALGKNVLMLAGGLGLAPLRPVVEYVRSQRTSFHRVHLLYGARDQDHLIFHDELSAWQKESDLELALTVDHAGTDWKAHVGTLPQLLDLFRLDLQQTLAFLCGPEIMMRLSAARLLELDMPPEQIYLSMERNMKCALGFCGHCQFGSDFICRDGPILRYDRIARWLGVKEL